SVGVLATVFADSRWVPLEVAGVERGLVECRGENEMDAELATHELLFHRCHRLPLAVGARQTGHHAPGLGDRINATFVVGRRAEGCAVVEIRATIPLTVPAVL